MNYEDCEGCGTPRQSSKITKNQSCNVCGRIAKAEQWTNMVREFCMGVLVKDIAKEYGMSPSSVQVRFAQFRSIGVPIPRKLPGNQGWKDDPNVYVEIQPDDMLNISRLVRKDSALKK